MHNNSHISVPPNSKGFFFPLCVFDHCVLGRYPGWEIKFYLLLQLVTVSETDSELKTDTGMNTKHEHTKYFHALDRMVSFEITHFCSQGGNSHRQDTSKWPWLCSEKSPLEHSSMNQTWPVACGLPTPSIKLYGPKGTFIPSALWLRTN